MSKKSILSFIGISLVLVIGICSYLAYTQFNKGKQDQNPKPSTDTVLVESDKEFLTAGVKNEDIKKPPQALKPDANNNVVSIENCNLSVKYSKQINDKYENLKFTQRSYNTIFSTDTAFNKAEEKNLSELIKNNGNDVVLGLQYKNIRDVGKEPNPQLFYIRCFESTNKFNQENYTRLYKDTIEFSAQKNFDLYLQDKTNTQQQVEALKLNRKNEIEKLKNYFISSNKQDLFDATGWEIAKANIENIVKINSQDKFRYQFIFTYNNKVYDIIFNTKIEYTKQGKEDAINSYMELFEVDRTEAEKEFEYKRSAPGIFSNQVNLQFDSVIKSESNVTLVK